MKNQLFMAGVRYPRQNVAPAVGLAGTCEFCAFPWTPLTHHEGGLPRYHEAAFARPHRRGSYRRRTWALSNRGGRPNAPRIPIWLAILPADTGARPSRPRERIVGNPELT